MGGAVVHVFPSGLPAIAGLRFTPPGRLNLAGFRVSLSPPGRFNVVVVVFLLLLLNQHLLLGQDRGRRT